ncbi:MAG: preprotein translocase subunit SecE [Candidatus Paceibacterota bacterium]
MKPIKFLKEVNHEFKKVKWPTQRQSVNITALVIILSVAIAYYLGAFDQLFAYLLENFVL